MGRIPWVTYLWPGLAQLSREGSWSALGLALGFSTLLNLALCASLVWGELTTPGTRNAIWTALGLIWVGSVISAYRWDRRRAEFDSFGPTQDAFAAAQDHYLKGNWFEAERLLSGLIADNPRDVDAGLMRATLLRHTGRRDEAAAELKRIERFERSRIWELEIHRERELLAEAAGDRTDEGEPTDESSGGSSSQNVSPISDAA